ncbi:TrkH family potassium uptake protein [Spirulina sp. CS-785/01]|uniref:TrkH family potassium uptake protein n=1 Tax=Spirulina sp. CS-785/01 TaxID=3021716 RepID=UPI00232D04B7|nr:TrkH family potassium uptake protein [Spirulina sp. CS-785/01]MDB9311583.1 TrkH family potassium uptake protein [Spirulina sp. CS-785/01]
MTIARTICLGFLTVILIGTILLTLPISTSAGMWNNPIVALFTATSAVCVTGLIVVDTGTHFSFLGELFILLLIQIGGLGYMTTTTFLVSLVRRKFDLRQKVAIQESFDRPFLLGSQNLIKSVIATTLIFEIMGILLLVRPFINEYGFNQGLWVAIFHTISAWNNAGFSLFSDSLTRYQGIWFINSVICALIIFGGIGYQVIIEMYLWFASKFFWQRRFTVSLNFKVVLSTTLVLLALGTVAFLFTEYSNPNTLHNLPLPQKILAAWFQSVTTRTAGFNTLDFGKMNDATLFIALGLMAIGASPSGTGGGIKTTTIRILINCTRSTLQGNEQVLMYSRKIPNSLILKAIAVVFGSGMMMIIITTLLSIIETGNFDFLDLFFEVISAFATVGLSTGITADLSAFGQLILIFTMFVGRVGILVFIAAIYGDPHPTQIQYPEENLLVG